MIAFLVVAALAGAAPSDADAIRSLRLAYNAAIAGRRPDEMRKYERTDFVLLDSMGVVLSGADRIDADYAREEFRDPTFIAYDRTPDTVTLGVGGAVAAEAGHWVGRWRRPDGTERQRSGVYLAQWVKADGNWQVRTESYVKLACGSMAACDR